MHAIAYLVIGLSHKQNTHIPIIMMIFITLLSVRYERATGKSFVGNERKWEESLFLLINKIIAKVPSPMLFDTLFRVIIIIFSQCKVPLQRFVVQSNWWLSSRQCLLMSAVRTTQQLQLMCMTNVWSAINDTLEATWIDIIMNSNGYSVYYKLFIETYYFYMTFMIIDCCRMLHTSALHHAMSAIEGITSEYVQSAIYKYYAMCASSLIIMIMTDINIV